MARTKQKLCTKPKIANSSAELMSDAEATDSDCDSIAKEEILIDPEQTEEQTRCNEIQEMSRALANATGNQMHFDNCITLAG
ncbi:hypothetical protein NPIL_255141 [Nephila pilipes]|uniref:Uncharacterized protein n=1 Tax=Nephila pilipes TaxID=299642 RepID=A0A8X6QEH9_NEPPI|nr:hypothetical protein NPIL_255141 [Nephila pilipes]